MLEYSSTPAGYFGLTAYRQTDHREPPSLKVSNSLRDSEECWGNRYIEVRRTFLRFSNFLRGLQVESEEVVRCCSSTSDFSGELYFLLF